MQKRHFKKFFIQAFFHFGVLVFREGTDLVRAGVVGRIFQGGGGTNPSNL